MITRIVTLICFMLLSSTTSFSSEKENDAEQILFGEVMMVLCYSLQSLNEKIISERVVDERRRFSRQYLEDFEEVIKKRYGLYSDLEYRNHTEKVLENLSRTIDRNAEEKKRMCQIASRRYGLNYERSEVVDAPKEIITQLIQEYILQRKNAGIFSACNSHLDSDDQQKNRTRSAELERRSLFSTGLTIWQLGEKELGITKFLQDSDAAFSNGLIEARIALSSLSDSTERKSWCRRQLSY